MTTKTQRDLNLEYWGRIHDMCDAYNNEHGTNIKPQKCVKNCGTMWCLKEHPIFDGQSYDLAVAIIEDKPVFYGDNIYFKQDGYRVTVGPGSTINPKEWTLTPPKPQRTFDLNGRQLPCPSTDDNCPLEILGEFYYFESIEDRNKVAKAINDLLNNARDKE